MAKNKCSGCWAVAVINGSSHCAAPKCHKDSTKSAAKNREHMTTADCWCEPEKIYVDGETGDAVYLHREIH